jgi:hypothetical protein
MFGPFRGPVSVQEYPPRETPPLCKSEINAQPEYKIFFARRPNRRFDLEFPFLFLRALRASLPQPSSRLGSVSVISPAPHSEIVGRDRPRFRAPRSL